MTQTDHSSGVARSQDGLQRLRRPLRALIVEDSEQDAQLLLRELNRGTHKTIFRRVETPEQMKEALAEQGWDVVLSDYTMPRFSAMAALTILKESKTDIPFIIVSGAIGEDVAVEALKAGAHDFLVKGRLARLLPAIDRELRDAEVRRERSQAIVDRQKAMDGLREAVRARDEFLSIASHELKTPITSLVLHLTSALKLIQNARDSAVGVEKLEPKLQIAVRQIDRLTALINNLLDVTRITAGRLSLVRRNVDLRALVGGWIDRYQEAISRSGSRVALSADKPVLGFWDPVALETVISNLLSNAVKFGLGRPIEVTIDRTAEVARLTVTDHGIGIAPEEQTRIFERFERAVPAEHYGGFGIGLWASRQMVDAHGGNIRVSSNIGGGSTFTVELPIEEQSPQDEHAAQVFEPQNPEKHARGG